MVNHSGGKANRAGTRYQTQVETYFSAMLLSEKAVTPIFEDIPSNAIINMLHFEQGKNYDVDDIIVEYDSGHKLFIQVTTTLHLSKSNKSKFADIISQFIKQYNSNSFKKDNCLLVIITNSSSSKKITEVLDSLHENINITERFDQCINKLSKEQQEVLNVIKEHAENIYDKGKGSNEELNVLDIIKVIRVKTLDFKNSSKNYTDTLELLRQQVIVEPEQDRNTYNALFEKCSDIASKSGSIIREDLIQLLHCKNIYLYATFSYRSDINILLEHTKRNIETLSKKAFFKNKDKQVKIPRECIEPLLKSVKTGSILIIGDPGVGKSGVLYELIHNLQNIKATILLLLCDTDDILSVGILKNEPSLKNNILDICSNWKDDTDKYLIIDGFDALRNPEKEKNVINLLENIHRLDNKWKIIINIRSYDLRYSADLQKLFKGQISEEKYTNSIFQEVKHFQIPTLSDQEILLLQKDNNKLASIFKSKNSALNKILKNVFFLSLYCDLYSNLSKTEINEIRSELNLLNKYWEQEILYNKKGYSSDRLTAILNEITSKMVDKFSLKVERKDIENLKEYDKESGYLFNTNILEDLENKGRIAFSHNILFDYAVNKQYLQGLTLRDFLNVLSGKSDLLLFIFPSFRYFYLEKWDKDKKTFFEYTFETLRNNTPILSHIIAPLIIVEEIASPDDVGAIFDRLKNSETRAIALRFIKYLNAALKFTFEKKTINNSNEIQIWYEISMKFNNEIDNDTVLHIQNLLDFLLFHPKSVCEREIKKCGILARKCLNHYLNDVSLSNLVYFGIKAVVKTINSDPEASYTLLKKIFELPRLEKFGSMEITHLIKQIKDNFPNISSAFIVETFDSAFSYFDDSQTKTPFTHSQILPIASTRAQDWGLVQYSLAYEIFPKYLDSYPELATASLIKIISLISEDSLDESQQRKITKPFTFLGVRGEIQQDYPDDYKLDQRFQFDVIERMLDTFTEFLLEKLKTNNFEQVKGLLQIVAKSTRSSIVWSKIIKKGIHNPKYFADILYELTLSVPFLTHFDIGEDLKKFLSSIYEYLSEEQRREIEKKFLKLPEFENESFYNKESLIDLSNELILVISKEDSQPDAFIAEFSTYEDDDDSYSPHKVSSNSRHIRTTHLEHLSLRGIKDIKESNNEIILQLNAIFTSPSNLNYYKNINKNTLDARIIILQDLFNQSQQINIEEKLSSYIKELILDDFSRIIDDCYDLSNNEQINTINNYFQSNINEYFNKKSEVNHNAFQSYPAKISIEGLIKLISKRGSLLSSEEKILWEIIKFKDDALIESLAFNLYRLVSVKADLVIDFLKILLIPDNSLQIIMSALSGINNFEILTVIEKNLINLAKKIPRTKDSSNNIDSIIYLIGELYFACNSPESNNYVNDTLESFESSLDEILAITQVIRSYLASSEDIRIRIFNFQEKVLKKLKELQDQLQERNQDKTFSIWCENDQNFAKKIQDLLDKIVFSLYNASGAAACNLNKAPNSSKIHELPPVHSQKSFVIETTRIFKKFKSLSIRPSILHNLFKTYEFLQRHNPKFIFKCFSEQLLSSKDLSYIAETLGRDVIINILNNTAAQFRSEVLTDSAMRKTYVEIVGLLIECDWPEAYEICYNFRSYFI